jgi:hypothetical protein
MGFPRMCAAVGARRLRAMIAPRIRTGSLVLIAVALLLAAAAVAPQAQARGGAAVKTMKLDARIIGTQTIDWHYQSDGWPLEDHIWDLGRGTQTLKFATSKAFPMQLVDARIPGRRLVTLSSVARSQPQLSGAVSRGAGWDHHVPRLCGGELGDCSTLQAPADPTFDCASRQMTVHMTTLEGDSQSGPGVRVVLTAASSKPFTACPPDQQGGAVNDLQAASLGPIALDHGLAEVAKLGRGKTIVLAGTVQRGLTDQLNFRTSCPTLKSAGYQQCEATKVRVELTRRR